TWIRAEPEGNDALPVAEAGDLGDRSLATSEPASDLKEEVKGSVYGRSGALDGSGLYVCMYVRTYIAYIEHFLNSQPFLVFGANKYASAYLYTFP
ncbi:unnamed protein product, partial [Musa textilis]